MPFGLIDLEASQMRHWLCGLININNICYYKHQRTSGVPVFSALLYVSLSFSFSFSFTFSLSLSPPLSFSRFHLKLIYHGIAAFLILPTASHMNRKESPAHIERSLSTSTTSMPHAYVGIRIQHVSRWLHWLWCMAVNLKKAISIRYKWLCLSAQLHVFPPLPHPIDTFSLGYLLHYFDICLGTYIQYGWLTPRHHFIRLCAVGERRLGFVMTP